MWYPALVKHENQHASHAIETARNGERKILAIPGKSRCQELDKRAKEVARELIQQVQHRDRQYDQKTNHGETEGAALYTYLN